jgi:hypothetical protein
MTYGSDGDEKKGGGDEKHVLTRRNGLVVVAT